MVKLDKKPANAHHLWDKVMLSYNKNVFKYPQQVCLFKKRSIAISH